MREGLELNIKKPVSQFAVQSDAESGKKLGASLSPDEEMGEPSENRRRLTPTLQKATSNSQAAVGRLTNESVEYYDKKDLPETLVNIFEIVVELAVDSDSEVREIHGIMFERFKSLISELDLENIIATNKALDGIKSDSRNNSVASRSLSLDCFDQIITILQTKMSESKDDPQVQEMFKGIVEYILREMYDSDEQITEKIYALLRKILVIIADMETMACKSLFNCVKKNFPHKSPDQTRVVLKKVLEKINPQTFISVLVQECGPILYAQGSDVASTRDIVSHLLNYITIILAFHDSQKGILKNLLFDQGNEKKEVFKLWSVCPSAMAKAALLCLNFDVCYAIMESQASKYSMDERDETSIKKCLNLAQSAHEMLKIIDTVKFTTFLSTLKNIFMLKKFVKLTGLLAMLAKNISLRGSSKSSNGRTYPWLELLKKVKELYSSSSEMDTEHTEDEIQKMKEEYKRFYDRSMQLYNKFRDNYNKLAASIPQQQPRLSFVGTNTSLSQEGGSPQTRHLSVSPRRNSLGEGLQSPHSGGLPPQTFQLRLIESAEPKQPSSQTSL